MEVILWRNDLSAIYVERRGSIRGLVLMVLVTNIISHLCYQKKFWRSNHGARALRDFHYCKVKIPRDTLHKKLHALVPFVPVPKSINAECALIELRMLEARHGISKDDGVEKRLRVLAALFDCIEQPTADAFRKQADIIHEFCDIEPS